MPTSTSRASEQAATAKKPSRAAEGLGKAASSGEQLLANAQTSRAVIQEFVPLSASLEWDLGQQYLRQRGNKAFISDSSPIPFVVNNDGAHSKNAATILFENLVAAEKNAAKGTDAEEIFVLELGIGVGLFARYFLDHFQELCRQNDRNYYDRLTYIAADKSERMLMDVLRHGVLANHAGRVKLRPVDAMEPGASLPADYLFGSDIGNRESGIGKEGKIRAVFLNYLLDCLPAAALDFSDVATDSGNSDGKGGEVGRPAPSAEPLVKELYVRTLVARNVKLEDFTDMKLEALKDRAISSDPAARQELLEVYGLFASEYDYRPVEGLKPLTSANPPAKPLPYWDFLLEYRLRHSSKKVLHSWGAIQSVERLLGLLHQDGFIIINDYGQTMVSRDDEFEHQRFSLATFVGVNFPMLRAYFAEHQKLQWLQPAGEGKGIHTRLLAHTATPELREVFHRVFDEHAQKELQVPIQKARECARVGRFELASTYYHEALAKQPRNWVKACLISG